MNYHYEKKLSNDLKKAQTKVSVLENDIKKIDDELAPTTKS